MKENKNIERLFQEKFKDFEVSPPDFVWENIQEKLHPKEQKRRVIPFWFKATGIAASFVAIVSVVFYNTNSDFNNTNTINTNNNNAVVNSGTAQENKASNQNVENNTFNTSETNTNQNASNSSFTNETGSNSKSNSLVNNDNSTNTISKADSKINKGAAQNSKSYKSNSNFVTNRSQAIDQNISFKKNKSYFTTPNSGIVTNNQSHRNYRNKSKNESQLNSKITDFNLSKNNNTNSEISDLNSFNKFNSTKINTTNSGISDLNTNTDFNSLKNKNSELTNINSSNQTTKNENIVTEVLADKSLENSNISTAIVAVEDVKIDTIALATVTTEENPLEKLLREKETKKVVNEKEKWSKWAVNSYVSPIFFNSFTSGSPISDEFASNEKTFNNSTSYGVGVAYALNKRFSIKTGISNLNLDYDTEDIAFYSSFEDQSKIANTNIERNANSKYLVLKHEKNVSKNTVENQVMQSSQNTGNLNQRTQYIEVPLEMSYAILNKKFGVAIKGGMSTLFLTENEISIKAPDGNMQIGKASNLNDVHFSSNVGLGFSYNFMKNFQLNLEPTLKYQINTFNKNSEDFSPYVIGVNTGISYKF
ncbi:outer membrane beta-barrel protein [Flavobacterium terrigena]|uniref:Outer membrane protein beta-barrel domain-containing protein n=1 Tax=Flavobacterium terrigena TaxID=402734 RepID=A0A1H6TKF1_9FLAO|nr:outer membrane beta-barrel protein [Flavobacterium terrigena]SEI80519.1 Outer membrane protein beta-barrel domain-containing protein [Flavobacterium terrigena]